MNALQVTCAVILAGMLCMSSAMGQDSTPQVVKVQGFLSDNSSGTSIPANGTFTMTFDLYDAEVGGLPVSNAGPLAVDVTQGLYEVALPFTASAFRAAQRYVEITVDGETLSPRIRVVSAPFAYVAERLEGFEGADLDQSGAVSSLQNDFADIQGQIDAASGDLADHEGASDPHSVYVKLGGDEMTGSLTIDGDLGLSGGSGVGRSVNWLDGDAVFRAFRDFRFRNLDDGGGVKIRVDADGQGTLFVGKAAGYDVSLSGDAAGGKFHLMDSSPGSYSRVSGYLEGSVGILKTVDGNNREAKIRGDGIILLSDDGIYRVRLSGIGGTVSVRDLDGNQTAFLDGTTGKVSGKVIEITGGADLAEPFELSDSGVIPQGSVLVIDHQNPGQLTLSGRPYDARVAGAVSGAGGIKPGLTLSQAGVVEGDVNVAIAGRVYVRATATNGAIHPGDLLTTSGISGRAMKATDPLRSHGAILGKAMSTLPSGNGLVLVLVNLQ